MANKISVLFDGWSLIYQPNSPAALHLLALLAAHPPEFEARVALPGKPPEWLPAGAIPHAFPTPDTPRSRLEWEQRRIPGIARTLGSNLVHLTTPTPALFIGLPVLVSPSGYSEEQSPSGLFSRLGEALAAGGMARLKALLWPNDLPSPGSEPAARRIPPHVFPAYPDQRLSLPPELAELDIPKSFILYHGPQADVTLQRLLAGWSWAAGSIGEDHPLLLLGLDGPARERLEALASRHGLEQTLRSLPAISPYSISWLYQECSALFHPAGVSPWGGPLRPALAYGKPVVASTSPEADALLGAAAYLAPEDSARQLGAALITVIVEDGVAEELSQAGRQRASAWQMEKFRKGLSQAYQDALAK